MNKIKFALHPDISTKARTAVGRHERAVYEKHGDRYDYSKVIFKSINVPVIIGCGIHGYFTQSIKNHVKSVHGCPLCSREYITRNMIKSPTAALVLLQSSHTDGDYQYVMDTYTSMSKKMEIICPHHGSFYQTPSAHVQGSGCRLCADELLRTTRIKSLEVVIREFVGVHGDRYDYSRVVYNGRMDKVEIVCPDHGHFWQEPASHLHGSGCPKCGKDQLSKIYRHTVEDFVERAVTVHGNRYDYSSVVYVNAHTKVGIICPTHGSFYQTPTSHLHGSSGCPQCGNDIASTQSRMSQDEFIRRADQIHNGKYDYSGAVYIRSVAPISISCPTHGVFKQMGGVHLRGAGCPKCSTERNADRLRKTHQQFVTESEQMHNHRYDYTKVVYHKSVNDVIITCPIHGEFLQTPASHLFGCGCPKCSQTGPSKGETAIGDRIVELLGGDESLVVRNSRKIISPLELDIYIPSAKLAIEYCGAYWHSDKMIMAKFSKGKYADLSLSARRKLARNYHYNKFKQCEDQGIRLITLFEDEWINSPDIVMSVINHGLGLSERGTGARKLAIKETDAKVAKAFLNQNHPQGSVSCTTYLGGYDGDQLVGVMGFGNPTRQNSQGVELKRFATSGKSYAGLAGRLFTHYVRNYDPIRIISFSDNRWFSGGMYKQLGFRVETNLPPDYSYIHLSDYRRVHKSTYRRAGIRRHFPEQYSEELTEREMMALVEGVERNFDCGKRRWVWGLSKDEYAIAAGQ